jgi:hypothetical protein
MPTMIKHSYSIEDARREIKELKEEGCNFSQIWIFLNDLFRGKDINANEFKILMVEATLLFN